MQVLITYPSKLAWSEGLLPLDALNMHMLIVCTTTYTWTLHWTSLSGQQVLQTLSWLLAKPQVLHICSGHEHA